MGFNSVYRVLQEVFPEVDTRLLRAVAIEHSKDADTAVEVVLVEILPFLSNGTTASGSSNDEAVEDAYLPDRSEDNPQVVSRCLDETVGSLNGASRYDVNDGHDQFSGNVGNAESIPMGKHEESNLEVVSDVISHVTPIDLVHENSRDDDCIHVNTKNEEINSWQESSNDKVGSDQGSHVLSTTSMHDFGCSNGILSANQLVDWEDFGGSSACDGNMVMQGESHHEHNHSDRNHLELAKEDSLVQLAPSLNQDYIQDAPEGDLQLAVVCPINSLHEKPESSDSSDAASKKDISVGEMVEMEDESTLNTVVTRSGQICRIDLLEDIIEDARSNKKTLFSAMESVISLMREVELQEKAAEQAKEETVRGGFDILARVEGLKQMLPHAMEANNMHSGEVYGEKAILATEVRELQSRVLCLLDERDKSLAILDEMRQTLEERLDAAEKERKAAEQEKMDREVSARNAFAEQERIMEKVVQESEKLKQEAEENSKLREFLMDRGRVVDMLQGEISVICQDVKLLKEKFDEHVPLSKSLSSSQTTCILASSSSSLKSMSPDLVPEQDESSETPKKTSPSPSDNDQVSTGEERERDDQKALMDDGWEFFDNQESYM